MSEISDSSVFEEAIISQLKAMVRPGLERLGITEQENIEASISVPVVRNAAGRVVQRSSPGEPPRMESGQLHANVEWEIVEDAASIVLQISSARPPGSSSESSSEDPVAAVRLEYDLNRTYMRPAFERVTERALQVITDHIPQ